MKSIGRKKAQRWVKREGTPQCLILCIKKIFYIKSNNLGKVNESRPDIKKKKKKKCGHKNKQTKKKR
jgi:hypothetical protein